MLLEDDPAFLPDLTLETLNLDLLDSDAAILPDGPFLPDSQLSNILSLPTSASTQGGILGLGLNLPSDTTGNADRFALNVSETRVSNRGPQSSHLLARDEEDCLLPEADFTFDAEGNLIEFTPDVHSIAGPSATAAPARTQRRERPGVRAEHKEGQSAGSFLPVSPQT